MADSSAAWQEPPFFRDGPSSLDRDQQDFVRLLVEHERRLEGFILALVPNWAVAEDIAQETKLRLWEQFGQFDRNQDFGSWACTIAYYQVLSYRKSNKRSREHLFGERLFGECGAGRVEVLGRSQCTAAFSYLLLAETK